MSRKTYIGLFIVVTCFWQRFICNGIGMLFNKSSNFTTITGIKLAIVDESYSKEDFPDPRTPEGAILCGSNTPIAYCCDPASVLPAAQSGNLSVILKEWASKAPCNCGECASISGPFYLIIVAIVPQLLVNGQLLTDSLSKMHAIEDFTLYILEGGLSGIELGACHDGVVLSLSIEDRVLWTAVGAKSQIRLKPECVKEIFDETRALYSNLLWYEGLSSTIQKYIATLEGTRNTKNCKIPVSSEMWWQWVLISVALFILLAIGLDWLSNQLCNKSILPWKRKAGVVKLSNSAADLGPSVNSNNSQQPQTKSSSGTAIVPEKIESENKASGQTSKSPLHHCISEIIPEETSSAVFKDSHGRWQKRGQQSEVLNK